MGYKLTGMYIGATKVRPNSIVIESDFTASTIADLQAQGWGNVVSTNNVGYTLNSLGFRVAHSGNDRNACIYYSLSGNGITNPSKISVYMEGNGTSGSWAGGAWLILISSTNTTSVQSGAICGNANFNNNSGSQAQGINYLNTGVSIGQAALATGQYEIQMDYDYSTGVCNYELTQSGVSKYSTSYTFNSTEMANIATMDYIGVCSSYGMWSGDGNSVTYAKITIS